MGWGSSSVESASSAGTAFPSQSSAGGRAKEGGRGEVRPSGTAMLPQHKTKAVATVTCVIGPAYPVLVVCG